VWRSGAERSCKEKVRFFVGEAVGSVYEIRELAFEVHGLVPCPEYRLGHLGVAASQVAQGAGRGLYHLFRARETSVSVRLAFWRNLSEQRSERSYNSRRTRTRTPA
jgi:hypothetical protein